MARPVSSITVSDRPVLPWRIVAGAFLHFALPAYLLVGLACGAVHLLNGASSIDFAARVIPYSLTFAVTYIGIAAGATLVAILLDPWLRRRRMRREARDPHAAERRSRRDLATALTEGRGMLPPEAVAILDTIASLHWQHEERVFQSVSADLAQVVRTSATALATAAPHRREDLAAITLTTLTRIRDKLLNLQEERGRLDEGDLHTIARYVDSRYPASDSAGDSIDGGVIG